ncbi:hypothetical protein EVG20_g170 [Dentipellis fragilis]|uniref:PDZ GRASP-type domain-containing protein n=1 Tax=Dentipellis fragilis TaxID=205917 RepID=A0A4Y9ZH79_9AGAM|nr:hypothetical protein EVG20_g170 [Dentipellis fragilis]
MGAGQSSASHDQPPSRALHVLRVTPSSPASQTNIEPFFDFIVGFEGDSVSSRKNLDAAELEKIVESHEGKSLHLLVWNSKNESTRVVTIKPSRAWSLPPNSSPNPREPEAESQPSLLGLSMRMCEPEFSIDNVWHVLDVLEGSPAESAGLVPYGDWIIGWSGGVLSAEGDFYDLVESHVDKPLRVYVYSYDFDTIREVVLVPNRQWGGEGLLGCVFGFGLLHRIPPITEDRQPGSLPEELHEGANDFEEQTLFVPADATDSHAQEIYAAHESGEPFMSGITSPQLQDYGYRFSTRGGTPQGNGSHYNHAYTIHEHEEEDHDHDHHYHHHVPEPLPLASSNGSSPDAAAHTHPSLRTPTPNSPQPIRTFSNGVPYAGMRSRPSILGPQSSTRAVSNGFEKVNGEDDHAQQDGRRPSIADTDGSSEATSEQDSLTSVE